MLICHCRAVNDATIRAAAAAGACGPDELGARCGAGTDCGGCLPALQALLDEVRGEVSVATRSTAA
jgi:bacterioferritin-associated ferredoxin